MCVMNIDCDEVVKKVKKLPKVFPCWKVMGGGRRRGINLTEYDLSGMYPIKDGVNEAGCHQRNRMRIKYPVGFHAFLRRKDCKEYARPRDKRFIRKFWAERKWITTKGMGCETDPQCGFIVVLSRIATSKEALEEEVNGD